VLTKRIIAFFIPLILLACKKEKTFWDTNWNTPLINDTLSLANYYNDSTFSYSGGNTINVDLTRTILDVGVEDLVKIPDTTISQVFTPSFNLNNIPPGYQFFNNIEEHVIGLGDVQLKKVMLSKGIIKLTVYNPIQTKVIFTIQLPGVTKNGVTFEKTYSVSGGSDEHPSIAVETLDLSGYTVDLTGENGLIFNELQSKLIIQTDPNGSTVSIGTANHFKFDAAMSHIRIEYAKGYFGNNIISDTSSVNIELFNHVIAGSINLPLSDLTLEIENGMKCALKGGITQVQNTNYQGNTVELSSDLIGKDVIINQAIGSWSTLQENKQVIVFNTTNSNIVPYIENLGNTQTLGYKLQLNPWGNTSGGNDEVFPNSRIKVRVKTKMPLKIASNGLTVRDTFDFNIKQDLTKTHIKSGVLTLNIVNAFPISCTPSLIFLDKDKQILHSLPITGEITSGLYGDLNPKNGLMEKKSVLTIPLSNEILSDIHLVEHIVVTANFNTPTPASGLNEMQSINYGAFLAVKIHANFETEIRY
jgi:hypothetical protein